LIIEIVVAGALASPPPILIGFDTGSAKPGDRVAISANGFRSRSPVRLYLVRHALRARIRSAEDRRLSFIAMLRPRRGRATGTFTVPPLDSGAYVAWCRGCRIRPATTLRVTMPAATADACPVTIPTSAAPPGLQSRTPPGIQGRFHSNGAIWTSLPGDGVWTPQREAIASDGSIGTKLFWFADGIDGIFALSGRRLDAVSAPLNVHAVNRGTMSGFRGTGTWATAVSFPSAGCWRLTARLRDPQRRVAVNLSFVLQVRVETR
jgi:hypothetical protein